MKPPFFLNIDVVGVCNLKCPSCPSGNWTGDHQPTGIMAVDLFERLLAKATAECRVTGVGLFNWNEPILHPQLPELIRLCHQYGVQSHISSNLNVLKDPEGVLAANPSSFRISASGFTQEVYGYTHRGGDIEKVKRHMSRLHEAKLQTGATTPISVLYHLYLHNLDDGLAMKDYCQTLGFDFLAVWAFMMPMEKILAASGDTSLATLTDEDQRLIANLALPLDGALAVSQQYKASPCALREQQITIDYLGNVWLCCSVFDADKSILGSYLELDLAEIQGRKHRHPSCGPCMDKGIHVYGNYGTGELNQIAIRHLLQRRLDTVGSLMNMSISVT